MVERGSRDEDDEQTARPSLAPHRHRSQCGGCAHYWERPGGAAEDFQRESAACIEDAKASPYGTSSMEPLYRACMRGKGWKRVEVFVADSNQFRGPEDDTDFLRPPSPMSGKRYYPAR